MTDTVGDDFDTFVEANPNATFSEWLRERARKPWAAMLDHRFVREVANDDIDPAVFERYLLQEYAVVDASAAATGYAIGAAPSMAERERLLAGLDGLVNDQRPYFASVFEELGVPESRWEAPETYPATERFEDLLLRAATAGGYVEALAPMAAAEWLYETWCGEAAAGLDSETPHGDWVRLHAEADFREHARWLRGELDRLGPALAPHRQRTVASLFERLLAAELAFHTAPYERER